MGLLQESEFGPYHRVTFETFVAAVEDFPKRKSNIASLSQSLQFPAEVGVRFFGKLVSGDNFLLGYSYQTETQEACIDVGVHIGNINFSTWAVDDRDLAMMTYRIRRDYPQAHASVVNAIPNPEQENDLFVHIWSSLWPSEGIRVVDVEQQFDALSKIAPRVRAQFFPPQQIVYTRWV